MTIDNAKLTCKTAETDGYRVVALKNIPNDLSVLSYIIIIYTIRFSTRPVGPSYLVDASVDVVNEILIGN